MRAGDALEGAEAPGLVQGAVAGHPGALAGHLLLLAGLVLDAPRLVCPGPVLLLDRSKNSGFSLVNYLRTNLTHWHVVTTKSANDQTRLSWIGL